jgi:hypothetical protein
MSSSAPKNSSASSTASFRANGDDTPRMAHRRGQPVVVELAGHHHRHGDGYRIFINLGLPGGEVLVSRARADEHDALTAHTSADRAFDEAESQLEDFSGDVARAVATTAAGRRRTTTLSGSVSAIRVSKSFVQIRDGSSAFFDANS